MTKGKRFLSLVLSLSAISLTACSEDYTYPDANWVENQIATIGGKTYTYNDIYAYFEGSKDSASSYFTVAKNVLAQLVTPVTDAMKSVVDQEINTLHDTWKSNAKTNGTSYKEEQEKTFDSENVEDEDELRAKKIAEKRVSQNETDFKQVVTDEETSEEYYLSVDHVKNYVTENAPYHVSHILVKVDASSSGDGFYSGQISSDDAKQLGNVARMLSSDMTFGSVAQVASDDGSASQYGELYTSAGNETSSSSAMVAMMKSTSYVNEFKLGLYAYDAFLNPNLASDTEGNTSNAQVRASLRVPGEEITEGDFTYENDTEVADDINNTLIGQQKAFGIPLSVCYTISYLATEEEDPVSGASVQYAEANQYPRNILFNNYFNYHGVNFIYDDTDEYDTTFWTNYGTVLQKYGVQTMDAFKTAGAAATSGYLKEKYDEYTSVSDLLANRNTDRFQTVGTIGNRLVGYNQDMIEEYSNLSGEVTETEAYTSLGTDKKILCDEKGNPIIVTRAGTGSGDSGYQGIHFIIVNNDPFTADANGTVDNKYKYYRVNIPDSSSTVAADSTDYSTNPSFVNFVKADANSNTTYNNRRNSVISVINSSDSNFDITLYKHNLETFETMYGGTFDDLVLGDKATIINKYIDMTLASTETDAEDSLDSSWETYVHLLNLQQDYAPKRMIPTVCVSYFEDGYENGSMYQLCHVDNK